MKLMSYAVVRLMTFLIYHRHSQRLLCNQNPWQKAAVNLTLPLLIPFSEVRKKAGLSSTMKQRQRH